jgi:hypothetical protein
MSGRLDEPQGSVAHHGQSKALHRSPTDQMIAGFDIVLPTCGGRRSASCFRFTKQCIRDHFNPPGRALKAVPALKKETVVQFEKGERTTFAARSTLGLKV